MVSVYFSLFQQTTRCHGGFFNRGCHMAGLDKIAVALAKLTVQVMILPFKVGWWGYKQLAAKKRQKGG